MAERYMVRVRGHLGPVIVASLDDVEAHVDGPDTVLTGRLVDQAALYGLLDRLDGLGLVVIEMRRIEER